MTQTARSTAGLVDDISIRQATVKDLEAINAIYNYYVLHSTCTYQTEPETMVDRRAWFDRHGSKHPAVVALIAGEVLGWGSLSPFHAREAYRRTVENSIYVRHDAYRRGIGSALLKDLILRASEIGHHTIIGVIDGEQAASAALHAKHGFVQVAHLRQVGFKFGRWLDVFYVQRIV
jgi:phosphinothricin acetyltransferase